jgi:hypothetical protein
MGKYSDLQINDSIFNNRLGRGIFICGFYDPDFEGLRPNNLRETLLQHVVVLESLALQLVQKPIPVADVISRDISGEENAVSLEVLEDNLSKLILP